MILIRELVGQVGMNQIGASHPSINVLLHFRIIPIHHIIHLWPFLHLFARKAIFACILLVAI